MSEIPAAAVGVRIFPRRLHIGLVCVATSALVIHPRPLFSRGHTATTLVSILLVLAGLAARVWAGGTAGEHTRAASIQAPRLATGGPYAYVRNPIYFASVILGFGMVGLLGDPWMLIPYATVFFFLYAAIVPAEERFLHERFGEKYARYCAAVPRLRPRLTAWPDAERTSFQRGALAGEAGLALVLAGILLGLRGAAWVRLRWLGF